MVRSEMAYRDSPSAWKGLVEFGGLEPAGRDEELADHVRHALNSEADSLEAALESAPVETFVEVLFRAIEPFPMMFRDILRFFESAGAREGQRQWRLVIDDEVLELKHFEEFEQEWTAIQCEFDVPAISGSDAFLPNTIRNELEGMEYLLDSQAKLIGQLTGLEDVDAWLAAYDAGDYAPFPSSLLPERLPEGLDDAARIVIAALQEIRSRGHDRVELLAALRSRRRLADRTDRADGLDFWTIAQNETDYWLRTTVQFLGRLLAGPETAKARFGAELKQRYSGLPRRRLNARVDIQDLVRLLSLPAWRKRHELFAVWVATEILAAVDSHDVKVNHADGELQIAFRETRIAEILSARPALSLYSERRTSFGASIGKDRKANVQPDYGLWQCGTYVEACSLVVEVKHYKRSRRRNFRDALVDYARAHPRAVVVLVNYGPVGGMGGLPYDVAHRCRTIGDLTPRNKEARAKFREAVRERVGEPASTVRRMVASNELPGAVVVDTSASMAAVLNGGWFREFAEELTRGGAETVTLVDDGPRATVRTDGMLDWIRNNELGRGTRLAAAVAESIEARGSTLVVTDSDGLRDLRTVDAEVVLLDEGEAVGAKVVKLRG